MLREGPSGGVGHGRGLSEARRSPFSGKAQIESRSQGIVSPAKRPVKKLTIGWINTVRPSRQLLRSFLRMRNFPYCHQRNYLMLRNARRVGLETRTAALQPFLTKRATTG
jgi:hypothetical protein